MFNKNSSQNRKTKSEYLSQILIMELKNTNQKNKVVRIVMSTLTFFIVVLSVLLLTVLISFVIVKFICCRDLEESRHNEVYNYQSIQYDSKTKETFTSFVSLPGKKMEEEEYITYEDIEGVHTLISPIGTQQYVCTGTCYCDVSSSSQEEGGERRVMELFARKGVFYFLVGLSAVGLATIAYENFRKKCADEFEDTPSCDVDSIHQEVDECLPIGPAEEQEVEEEREEPSNSEGGKESVFQCTGQCVLQNFFYHGWEYAMVTQSETLISYLEEKSTVCDGLNLDTVITMKGGSTVADATKKFKDELMPFCEGFGKFDDRDHLMWRKLGEALSFMEEAGAFDLGKGYCTGMGNMYVLHPAQCIQEVSVPELPELEPADQPE